MVFVIGDRQEHKIHNSCCNNFVYVSSHGDWKQTTNEYQNKTKQCISLARISMSNLQMLFQCTLIANTNPVIFGEFVAMFKFCSTTVNGMMRKIFFSNLEHDIHSGKSSQLSGKKME